MTTECKMAEALMEAWAAFTISPAQFRRIADDLAATVDDGLAGRPSPLQMLPAFVGKPRGDESHQRVGWALAHHGQRNL